MQLMPEVAAVLAYEVLLGQGCKKSGPAERALMGAKVLLGHSYWDLTDSCKRLLIAQWFGTSRPTQIISGNSNLHSTLLPACCDVCTHAMQGPGA